MGHIVLISNDIRYLFENNESLTDRILGKDSDLKSRWEAFTKQVDAQMESQLMFKGEPVFWSGSRYQDTQRLFMVSLVSPVN